MQRLSGRTALVTGAGSGLGAAIAERFAAEGAAVACADIDGAAAVATADRIGSTAMGVALDVTDSAQQTSVVAEVFRRLGTVDVCVANAGIAGAGSADSVDEAFWQRVMNVNLTGVWLTARAVLPGMIAAGGGSIVTMASIGGLIGVPALAPYAAAKGGVIALTRQMAVDYAARGVRVNAIAPGTVMTPLVEATAAARGADNAGESYHDPSRHYPLNRLGTTDDVSAAAVYLASGESGWVTGTVLTVDGGRTAQ